MLAFSGVQRNKIYETFLKLQTTNVAEKTTLSMMCVQPVGLFWVPGYLENWGGIVTCEFVLDAELGELSWFSIELFVVMEVGSGEVIVSSCKGTKPCT